MACSKCSQALIIRNESKIGYLSMVDESIRLAISAHFHHGPIRDEFEKCLTLIHQEKAILEEQISLQDATTR